MWSRVPDPGDRLPVASTRPVPICRVPLHRPPCFYCNKITRMTNPPRTFWITWVYQISQRYCPPTSNRFAQGGLSRPLIENLIFHWQQGCAIVSLSSLYIRPLFIISPSPAFIAWTIVDRILVACFVLTPTCQVQIYFQEVWESSS